MSECPVVRKANTHYLSERTGNIKKHNGRVCRACKEKYLIGEGENPAKNSEPKDLVLVRAHSGPAGEFFLCKSHALSFAEDMKKIVEEFE